MYTCGSIVVIVFLLIACLAGVIWGVRTVIQKSITPLDELSSAPGPAPAQAANELPATIRTMLPAGMEIISVPTPAVVQEAAAGILNMQCPSNALEAAEVFGGSAAKWTEGEMGNGWVMATTEPETIRVPETMTAGYMVVSVTGMEMKSVIGPVTLKDIYMISIACD